MILRAQLDESKPSSGLRSVQQFLQDHGHDQQTDTRTDQALTVAISRMLGAMHNIALWINNSKVIAMIMAY